MRFMIAFLALLAMPVLAAAEEPTVTPTKDEKATKQKAPGKVCRLDPNSASRLPKRICKPAEEWGKPAEFDGSLLGDRS